MQMKLWKSWFKTLLELKLIQILKLKSHWTLQTSFEHSIYLSDIVHYFGKYSWYCIDIVYILDFTLYIYVSHLSVMHIFLNLHFVVQIAREHRIPFLETSAKSNINVEKAFLDLAQAILNKVSLLYGHVAHFLMGMMG